MPLHDWVSVYEADNATSTQLEVLENVGKMLDRYAPPLLDKSASSVLMDDHRWNTKDAVLVRLVPLCDANNDLEDAAIELSVGTDNAVVSSLSFHGHVLPDDAHDDRSWADVVVDVVAGFIRGDYEVVEYYRNETLIKTTLRDIGDLENPRMLSETGSLIQLLTSWVPWRRPNRVVTNSGPIFGIDPGTQ